MTVRELIEEREYIVTSMIRLIADCDFSNESISCMVKTARRLREIELDGGVVDNNSLFRLYMQMRVEDE